MKAKISAIILFLIASNAYAFQTLPEDAFTFHTQKPSIFSLVWKCKWRIACYKETQLGALTDIASTDQLSAFPTAYNANLKYTMETGTTSVASITTLSNLTSAASLATVGALSSGSLTTGFTAVPVSLGGTGTTTIATNQVLIGSSTNGVGIVVGHGSSGQVLGSNGPSAPPTWQTLTVGLANNNAWTGRNQFVTATTSVGSSDGGITLNGVDYMLPSNLTGIGSGTVATLIPETNATGTIRWQQPPIGYEFLGQTVTTGAQATVTVSSIPSRRQYMITAYAPSVSTGGKTFMSFQCCDQSYQWNVQTGTSTTGRDHKANDFFNGFQLQELAGVNQHTYTVYVNNTSGATKSYSWTGASGRAIVTYLESAKGGGLWASSTQSVINEVNFFANGDAQAATFGAGTVLTVYGSR